MFRRMFRLTHRVILQNKALTVINNLITLLLSELTTFFTSNILTHCNINIPSI